MFCISLDTQVHILATACWVEACQLVEQLFQFMKKVKMIEVVYCSTVKWSPYL